MAKRTTITITTTSAGVRPDDDEPVAAGQHPLLSVGIDIGSAGTQVIFSRLHLRRLAEDLTSRYFVVDRETLYQSPVALTPYLSEERIDEQAIGAIIDEAYAGAGVHPDNIDTGAVILTGEALRRENAQAIGEVLAEVGGEFVCADRRASHGVDARRLRLGRGEGLARPRASLLNIDIGGGTTKLALVEGGTVVQTAAIHIGGRLPWSTTKAASRASIPAGQRLAALAGCDWHARREGERCRSGPRRVVDGRRARAGADQSGADRRSKRCG